MIKLTTALLFLLVSFTGFSQQIKLRPGMPEVRQGENIGLGIYLEKDSITLIDGGFDLTGSSNDTGIVMIGPVSIKINNTIYTSDSFPIRVIEKLPNEASGIWTKIVKTKNGEFLILEERVDMNKSQSYANRTYSMNSNMYAVNEQGLKISQRNYNSIRESITDKDGITHPVNHQVIVYKIEKDKTFKGNFKLEKRYFNILSDEGIFPELIIDK